MDKQLKPVPRFATESDERRFWETSDSFDYVDWDKAECVRFPNLLASDNGISIEDTPAPADGKAMATSADSATTSPL